MAEIPGCTDRAGTRAHGGATIPDLGARQGCQEGVLTPGGILGENSEAPKVHLEGFRVEQ